MKDIMNILKFNGKALAVAVLAAGLCSCSDWTSPEALDIAEGMQTASEVDLAAVRAFKQGEHKTVILGMDATAATPVARYQHLMSMPDSADYIYIRNLVGGLHGSIVSEIAEVREKKGTKVLADIDYISVENEWREMQDERMEAGEPTGTVEEFRTFCKERFEAQLECCDKFGCDGIMASYNGAASYEWAMAGRTAFINAVMDWYATHQSKTMFVRGTLAQIPNATSGGVEQYDWKSFIKSCGLIVYPIGSATTAGELNIAVRRIYRGYEDDFPLDRFVFEATVPNPADLVQAGMPPAVAAAYVLIPDDRGDFSKLGLCVENAQDDYFNIGNSYVNLRRAITVLNTEPAQES